MDDPDSVFDFPDCNYCYVCGIILDYYDIDVCYDCENFIEPETD